MTNRKLPRSLMLLIPLPASGGMHYEVHEFLEGLKLSYLQAGVAFHSQIIAGMDQAQCRAELLAFYYRNRAHFEDVGFLDADTVVGIETIHELGRLEEPVVVIPYEARRRDERKYENGAIAHWAIDTSGRDARVEVREGRRMMAVRGSGLGCVRFRREVIEAMWDRAKLGAFKWATPVWTSDVPGIEGTEVCGLFEHVTHEHPDGSGVLRRRPEDMSFFLRANDAGFQPYALCDQAIWHDGKGGVSLWDALVTQERERARMRRRVDFELVDCPDNLLGLHEVLDGAYEIPGLELGEGETILDLGANVGAFAVWASKRFPGSKIHCYEPVPENYERLKHNIAAADMAHDCTIHTSQVAVVGSEAVASIRIAPGRFNDGEWSVKDEQGAAHDRDRAIEVPAMPARKLPPCSVLKADTEGCEVEILAAYPHLRGCKALMLEWHTLEDYRALMKLAREAGFIPMVDRARGKPMPDRELCFMRRDVFLGKVEEQEREHSDLNGHAHA